jgi:poly(A) polymerase
MRRLALTQGRLVDLSPLRRHAVARALALLNAEGEEARIVGGAVRDLLLGQPPGDFDLATTATPDVVISRAAAAGVGHAPTGIAHGTVTLIVDGTPIEITTLRKDIETDGRRAKVRFGRDFRDDALRRDFTINALSLDVDGFVHDDVGGVADLAAGRIRFIGEAQQRIREDFLRILRFFRFSARFGDGELDRTGFAAAIATCDSARMDRFAATKHCHEFNDLRFSFFCALRLMHPIDNGVAIRRVQSVKHPTSVRVTIQRGLQVSVGDCRAL